MNDTKEPEVIKILRLAEKLYNNAISSDNPCGFAIADAILYILEFIAYDLGYVLLEDGSWSFTDDVLKTRKFRKKPVIVEAYQTTKRVTIETLEGTMVAEPGDWVVLGTAGERYPVKEKIFNETYERADEPTDLEKLITWLEKERSLEEAMTETAVSNAASNWHSSRAYCLKQVLDHIHKMYNGDDNG